MKEKQVFFGIIFIIIIISFFKFISPEPPINDDQAKDNDNQVKSPTSPPPAVEHDHKKETGFVAHDHQAHHQHHQSLSDNQSHKTLIKKGRLVDQVQEMRPEAINDQDFNRMIHLIAQSLGTRDDIKELSDHEVHHIPPVVSLAGIALAHLKKTLNQRPEYREKAHDFYHQCVQDEQIVDSIRALCLTHMGLSARKSDIYFDIEAYPEHLQRLAEIILSIQ